MNRRTFTAAIFAAGAAHAAKGDFKLEVSQCTFGPKNHFFGYIGHVQNIPWNADNRYIVALETSFQDRMPRVDDAARVVLIDTQRDNAILPIDESRAWNFQQGTMFYWNPASQRTQLFFNDRDRKTNRVFTVLYDIEKQRRIREFRYDDTPFGNSGVAQKGGWFCGLNYGRLARLRLVTGYPEAYDWTRDVAAPENDGVWIVDATTGRKRLLVSYKQLAEVVAPIAPTAGKHLFVNHTLCNRDNSRIYFYVRADYIDNSKTVNCPCSIHPDGTGLKAHKQFIGGHPEWESGSRIIGSVDDQLVVYDVDRERLVDRIGDARTFVKAGGDTALSPDGRWIVNGSRDKTGNVYTVYRRSDGATARSRAFAHPGLEEGELRVDGSPCWNRTGDAFLFPAIANDPQHTRQLFLARVVGT